MPIDSLKEVPRITGIIVIVFGLFGAIINFVHRKEKTMSHKITMFVVDMISSVMLSIITFLSVVGFGGTELLAVGLAGFVAHQGTRAVLIIELIIAKKFNVELPNIIIKEETKDDKQ